MHRFRSILIAITAVALTAGLVAAHSMPSASDNGIATAQSASGKAVPMAHLPEGPSADEPDEDSQAADAPSADTHGAAVSEAAQNPTPTDGGWANHGDYVSSIATGWGAQTASDHMSSQGADNGAQGADHSAAGQSHAP